MTLRLHYNIDRDIYLVATNGSDVRRLTFTGDNLAPSFSPDGNWIVFTSARDGDNELYIMRLDGSGRAAGVSWPPLRRRLGDPRRFDDLPGNVAATFQTPLPPAVR